MGRLHIALYGGGFDSPGLTFWVEGLAGWLLGRHFNAIVWWGVGLLILSRARWGLSAAARPTMYRRDCTTMLCMHDDSSGAHTCTTAVLQRLLLVRSKYVRTHAPGHCGLHLSALPAS